MLRAQNEEQLQFVQRKNFACDSTESMTASKGSKQGRFGT